MDFGKNLKNIFVIIFFFVIGFFIYNIFFIYKPCDKQVEYSIGRFDKEFGINESEFLSYIKEGEKVWEDLAKKQLFVYKNDSKFKINLIYDERQKETLDKQRTEFGLENIENIFENLDRTFETKQDQYESDLAFYEKERDVFESYQKEYEKRIAGFNNSVRISKKDFDLLKESEKHLNDMATILNNMADKLKQDLKELNILLESRNQSALNYNEVVKSYNQKYGHNIEFDQAEYRGEEINIYQFSTKGDLRLAIAHELGHSLGLGHTENPKSIMYYITNSNNENNLVATDEDVLELNRVCDIK